MLAANRAARELTGEDPVGGPAAAWLPADRCRDADGRPLTEEQLPAVRAARGERLRGAMVTCDTPRGARMLRVSAETVQPPDGPPVALVTCEDVTELRAAQLGERLVADDLRSILEGIADAVTAQGARRLARLRQRRRRARCSASRLRRGAAERPAGGDHGPLGAARRRPASRCRSMALPGRRALMGEEPEPMLVQFREPRRQRVALVAHQGEAGARGRRHGAAGDQRDRGRHRAQAGRAGPALPRRGEPRARRLARLRGDAGDDRQAGGPGRRRLVRRRPRRRRAVRDPARRGRARRPGQGRARPGARRALPRRAAHRPRAPPGAPHRRVAAVAAHPGRADRRRRPRTRSTCG